MSALMSIHHQENTVTSSIVTSIITAGVALIPDQAISYAEKLASVLILAMVAEAGRRIVGMVWAKLPGQKNKKDEEKK